MLRPFLTWVLRLDVLLLDCLALVRSPNAARLVPVLFFKSSSAFLLVGAPTAPSLGIFEVFLFIKILFSSVFKPAAAVFLVTRDILAEPSTPRWLVYFTRILSGNS